MVTVFGYELKDDQVVPVLNINLLFHDLADLLNMVILMVLEKCILKIFIYKKGKDYNFLKNFQLLI